MNETPVVLRVWRVGNEVLALFPTLPSDVLGYYCDSYEHVGQHCSAIYLDCIRATRPATRKESAALVRELKQRGYKLRIVKRVSSKMHQTRRKEASQ